MLGFNLEWNEWAIVLGLTYCVLRLLFTFALLWWHTRSSRPYVFMPSVLGTLPSGLAGAAIAIGTASIVEPQIGWFRLYVWVGMVGCFFGLVLDLNMQTQVSRLAPWLTSFRVPQLREQLLNPDVTSRIAAVTKLYLMGRYARPALPELRTALRDESPDVRGSAAMAMLNVLPDPPPQDDDETPKAARAALGDSNLYVRTLAAVILVRYNAPAEEVLLILCEALTRSDDAEAFAAEAIGRLGSAAEPAIPLLRDTVIGQSAANDDVELLNVNAVKALGMIGAPAVPALIEIIEQSNSTCQYHAAETLGKMGDPALPALKALRRIALQSHNVASLAAKQAIQKLGGETKYK